MGEKECESQQGDYGHSTLIRKHNGFWVVALADLQETVHMELNVLLWQAKTLL